LGAVTAGGGGNKRIGEHLPPKRKLGVNDQAPLSRKKDLKESGGGKEKLVFREQVEKETNSPLRGS